MKKAKKMLALLVALAMIFTITQPITAYATTKNSQGFAGGSGTEDDPYLIVNKEQLNNVRNYLSSHFKLLFDIEFNYTDFAEGGDFYNEGAGFEPIGKKSDPFTGSFDGNYHTIKNLYINASSSSNNLYVGLFGYISGTIKNLGMIDIDFLGAASSSKSVYIGGITGGALKSTITNCYSTGRILGSAEGYGGVCAGGIVGNFDGGEPAQGEDPTSKSLIEKCYSFVNIKAPAGDSSGLGGIAGFCYSATISDCYTAGNLYSNTPTMTRIGGIVGGADNLDIKNCYNTGNIVSNQWGYKCGIAAGYGYRIQMLNCYYIDNVSKGISEGNDTAIKCTAEELAQQSTFVGFDFENVWKIDSDSDYAYPQLNTTPVIIPGDADGDEEVNSLDLLLVKKYLAQILTIGEINISAVDMDNNGIVNAKDLLLLKKNLQA